MFVSCPKNKVRHKAFISLGSNLESQWGKPEQNLDQALQRLAELPEITIEAVSPRYLTEPQGFKDQPWFANQVAQLSCDPAMTAHSLLTLLLQTETAMGRTRPAGGERFGPRVIDLDLLLFDQEICHESDLILPHPRLAERAFVLIPLCDLDENLLVPGILPQGTTVANLRKKITYKIDGKRLFQL